MVSVFVRVYLSLLFDMFLQISQNPHRPVPFPFPAGVVGGRRLGVLLGLSSQVDGMTPGLLSACVQWGEVVVESGYLAQVAELFMVNCSIIVHIHLELMIFHLT